MSEQKPTTLVPVADNDSGQPPSPAESDLNTPAQTEALNVSRSVCKGDLISRFATLTSIQEMLAVKQAKSYRGAKYRDADGHVHVINTWAEFCSRCTPRVARAWDEDIENLENLGPQFIQARARLGLNRSATRLLRAAPDDDRAQLVEQVVNAPDKDAVRELVEDLVEARHGAEHERTLAERRANAAIAQRTLHAHENEQLREALSHGRYGGPWPEWAEVTRVESAVSSEGILLHLAELRRAVTELRGHEQPNSPEQADAYTAAAGALQQHLRTVAAEAQKLAADFAASGLTVSDDPEIDALLLYSDEELATIATHREIILRKHSQAREARRLAREAAARRGPGRPRGSKNKSSPAD